MHARVTTVQLQTDKIDEAVRIGNETQALLRDMQGFHELTVFADRETGNGLIVSIWESEADLRASETGVYARAMSKLASVLTGPASRSNFEVILHSHTEDA